MLLNKEQLEKLNAFCGYGDFPNADIIYFGMEEGLGGLDLETNIIARCKYYGNDSEGWLDSSSWKQGYFERSGSEAQIKMNQCARDRGIVPEEKRQTTIQSLEYMSRLSLYLENPQLPWFELQETEPELYKIITAYWREARLYHPEEKVKTALFDWKPFPRANTSYWPYEIENQLFTEKEYQDAFDLKPHSNSYLDGMVQKRLDIIERLFTSSTCKVLLGFGGRDDKVKLLTRVLSKITNTPVKFENVNLPISNKVISVARVKIRNIERIIICSPFFDSKILSRKGLQELAHFLSNKSYA